MRRHSRAPLALAIAFAFGGTAARAEIIGTMPSWDGTSSTGGFGEFSVTTVGQTIATGTAETVLDSFTFQMNTIVGTTRFAAYVMEWDQANGRATGPVLFNSGLMTHANTGTFDPITVNPGVHLKAAAMYVLFYSISDYFDGVNDSFRLGTVPPDAYAGGGPVLASNGTDFGALSSSAWFAASVYDLAFSAELSPAAAVPEPGSLALAASGVLGLALVARARRRR